MNHSASQTDNHLFKTVPSKILVIKPYSFEIIAVTEEYLRATLTRESDIVGKTLFEVFPDNPADQQSDGVQNLLSSLKRVQSLKTPDVMGVQRYPIRQPNGNFEERFWSPVNSPVLDEAGEIEFIMHRVEDVTEVVKEITDPNNHKVASIKDAMPIQEIILRSKELRQALSKLQEYEARMRTAERLLNLGAWDFDVNTGLLGWSEQVFDIYDMPVNEPVPDFEQYFAQVHPDDRDSALAIYETFAQQQLPQLEFEHRVITRDGSVRYIKGVGERHISADNEIIVGYVLDITPLIKTRHKLAQAEQLLQIAGGKARLGGWRVELDPQISIWTAETAAIHDMPVGFSPASVEEAIQFYTPEYRVLVQEAFERCAREGVEFDIICRLQTPEGNRPWVRAIGMAEWDDQGQIIAVQGAFQDISILRQAQEKAAEAEQQRLNVLESISDGFFTVDEYWNFTFANQQAGILLERSRHELLGRNLWEEYPQALGTEFERQYRQAVKSQQTISFQAFYPPLDKLFDVSAYPTVDGLAVYFRDVTIERERQEQLRLVEAALSRQNDIVMITEADQLNAPDGPRIVYVNDAFERITGYTKNEVIGRTPRLLQGPDSDRQQLNRIREALQKKESIRCEVLNYKKIRRKLLAGT